MTVEAEQNTDAKKTKVRRGAPAIRAIRKTKAKHVMNSRITATLSTAAAIGLTAGTKTERLSGRAHAELLAAAQARSGLDGSDLLEYALAKVALEDDFAERLLAREGSIDRDIDLGI